MVIQNLITSKKLPWIFVLIIGLFLYIAYRHIETLNIVNDELQSDKQELINIIDDKNSALLDLYEQNSNNEQLFIEQKNKIQTMDTIVADYKIELANLRDENETLKAWFNTNIPNDLKRLYKRPYIKGSQNYQIWVSNRNSVLSTRK